MSSQSDSIIQRNSLINRYNRFNHISGETVQDLIKRYTKIIAEMRCAGFLLDDGDGEVNRKLMCALPRTKSWDTNDDLIRKNNDIYKMKLKDLIAIIKSYDRDDKQRDLNHARKVLGIHHAVVANLSDASLETSSSSESSTAEVSTKLCSQSCVDKIEFYRKHNDELKIEVGICRGLKQEFITKEKAYKEKIEALNKDITQLKQDISNEKFIKLNLKSKIQTLTDELENFKSKYETANYSFKKFEMSSKVVDNMLDRQLHGGDTSGLCFKLVPPPFNDNYTSMLLTKEEEKEAHMVYGKGYQPSSSSETVESVLTAVNPDFKCVNNADASTSCAEKVIVEELDNDDDLSSVSKSSDSILKNLTVSDSKCLKNDKSVCTPLKNLSKSQFVKPAVNGKSEKYAFKYTKEQLCRLKEIASPKHFKRDEFYAKYDHHYKRREQDHAKQRKQFESFSNKLCNRSCPSCSSSSSTRTDNAGYVPYAKKQTCYNCGITGHMARNCNYRPYVPYYVQNQRVTPKENYHSKPMKVSQPKAMKNVNPKVKAHYFTLEK